MLDARIRRYSQSDANDVYAMFQNTEELHVAGLTYSEKLIPSWHVMRAEDVLLIAQAAETVAGFVAARLNDPGPGAAYIDCFSCQACVQRERDRKTTAGAVYIFS